MSNTDNDRARIRNSEQEDADDEKGSTSDQKRMRVRLTQRSVDVLKRYRETGLSDGQLVEGALVLADAYGGITGTRLSDVAGVLVSLRTVMQEETLAYLEVFKTLNQIELLLERRLFLAPLEDDIKAATERLKAATSPAATSRKP